MFKLNSMLQFVLLKQPESGSGYQVVKALTADSKFKNGIVYNSELLLFEEEPRDMLKGNYYSLLAEAKISTGEITWLTVVTNAPSIAQSLVLKETPAGEKRYPAKDANPEKTKEKEVFKRFSAYENDRRVTPDGKSLPGTYATTEADANNVRTGKESVARYSLPNPKPASNKWTIEPHKDTVIQYGIVEPAFGEPGGGVEVIFRDGTQSKTVTGPEKIPDE